MISYYNYKNLVVWQKAMALVALIYQISANFPDDEKFGLISQIRRAAVSIPSNIAEGYGRENDKEFNQFLKIALGSISEVETQILIAEMLGFCNSETQEDISSKLNEIKNMVHALRNKIRDNCKA